MTFLNKYIWGTAHPLTKHKYTGVESLSLLNYVSKNNIPINCGYVYTSRPEIKRYLQTDPSPYYIEKIGPTVFLSSLLNLEHKQEISDLLAVQYLTDKNKYDVLLKKIIETHSEVFKKGPSSDLKPVDLLLIHSPLGSATISPSHKVDLLCWTLLLDLKKLGLVKEVGVSNYSIASLKNLKQNSGLFPLFNEIEVNPYATRGELLSFCFENDIKVLAYWTIRMGDPTLLAQPILTTLAQKYQTYPSIIIYQWLMQKSSLMVPIIGTLNLDRLQDLQKIEFHLEPEDIKKIESLNKNHSYANPTHSFWDWTLRD